MSMDEEFLESEVVFSDSLFEDPPRTAEDDDNLNRLPHHDEEKKAGADGAEKKMVEEEEKEELKDEENADGELKEKEENVDEKKKVVVKTMPVSIPQRKSEWPEEEDMKEWMVPPHLIVARRLAEKMALSVCFGNGRTLKGRDLSHFRNSILRMTGFIEA